MLPPTDDITRINSVDNAPSCARVWQALASRMPKLGHRKSRAKSHHHNSGNMREQIELEHSPGPHKHDRQLRKCQQRVERHLACEQLRHRHARTQHAVQRAAFGLIQQRPGRATGREQQKHHADRSRIKRHHGILLVLSHHRARRDTDDSAIESAAPAALSVQRA